MHCVISKREEHFFEQSLILIGVTFGTFDDWPPRGILVKQARAWSDMTGEATARTQLERVLVTESQDMSLVRCNEDEDRNGREKGENSRSA